MPAFIANARGAVARVRGPRFNTSAPMPLHIKLDEMFIGSERPNASAIITQAGIVQNGNFQFLHTINETIYAYVFGDRMGELRISGVAFSELCNNDQTGSKQVLDMYDRYKMSKRAAPVFVNFGETPFRGFLTGMNLDITDAETQLGQWAFRFHTFPGRT